MPPKAKGRKAARKMPPPLPAGEILTDGIKKQQWVIGPSIGKGGFGEIYMASPKGQDPKKAEHVIKIEPHENGPLFCELSYYRRVAKEDTINQWARDKGLKYLPCPKYITSGNHSIGDVMYRFLVMQRFGDDIERHFRACSRFCEDTVSYLALRLLEGLEFLHESEYVHADIKGSNVLTGLGREADRVYLVDYGLAYRFNPSGTHKEYKEDPKKAHDGTIEFTSVDAHNGASPSRRGDLEILGYCLLQWTYGKLPWEDNLKDPNYVARRKKQYHGDAGKLVKDCCGSGGSKVLQNYMAEVYKLQYADAPPYPKLRKLFEDHLKGRDPKRTLEWLHPPKAKPAKSIKPRRSAEEGPSGAPVKYQKLSPVSLPLPRKIAAKRLPSSSDGSDRVDSGEKVRGKKAGGDKRRGGPSTEDALPKGKKPKIDRLPKGKKAEAPPRADRIPKGKAKMDGPDHILKGKRAKISDPPTEDRPPQGKKPKTDADSIPEAWFPLELGYASEEAGTKESRRVQSKGKNPPSRENGKTGHEEAVSPIRRSDRNRGKVVNYAPDLSSSFNDSRGTTSFQESGDEEENTRHAPATKRRKRT